MGKTNAKADSASKLQEVILAKTMASLNGKANKNTKAAKASTKETAKAANKKAGKSEKPATKPNTKATKEPKAKVEREVKYIYPEGCNNSLDRKKFRAQCRAAIHQFETKLEKAKEGTKEYKAIMKEFKEYQAQYLRG